MGWLDTFQRLVDEQVSEKGPVKTAAKLKASDKSVMDQPILRASSEEIEKQKAEEQALTGPTIFGISIDPTDYLTPGGLAKIGAGIGKGLMVGAMAPSTFLAKNPSFANTIFKDASGNIKELYHGTSKDKDFKKFAANKRGTFVGEDPKIASEYALQNDSMGYSQDGWKLTPKNTASQVKPLYVNVQSPYYLEGEELASYVRSANYAKTQREIMARAISKGHDAVIYPDGGIAVANPSQIKSSLTGD